MGPVFHLARYSFAAENRNWRRPGGHWHYSSGDTGGPEVFQPENGRILGYCRHTLCGRRPPGTVHKTAPDVYSVYCGWPDDTCSDRQTPVQI